MDSLLFSLAVGGNSLEPLSWEQTGLGLWASEVVTVQPSLRSDDHDVETKRLMRERVISHAKSTPPKPLPLPDLSDTLDTLEKMSPIEGDKEKVAAFIENVKSFRTGVGEKLHNILKEKANQEKGWLSDLWGEMYNGIRLPAPGFVSFGIKVTSDDWCCESKMAHAVLATCEYHQKETEQKPSAMNQAESLFNNHKPGRGSDHLKPCKTGPEQHIVVFSKGQIYKIQIANREGSLISHARLAEQLETLQEASDQRQETTDLTPLTAVGRDQCAELQQQFASTEANKKLIGTIDDAFCCVCFDATPNAGSVNRQLLAGDGYNRWFDKTLQFIQLPKERIGVTIEHTPADATAWFPLFKYINDTSKLERPSNSAIFPEPEQLIPEIEPLILKPEIEKARKSFEDAISDIELKDIVIEGVSRQAIKDCEVSPDAFYQMVFQVAVGKAGYQHPPVYESVSMSKFKYGRTEGLRSRSPESIALIDALNNTGLSDKEKRACLIKAVNAHSAGLKKCKDGEGIHRHLFALEKTGDALYQEQKDSRKPELFTDPVYLELIKKNTLSTSCVAGPDINRFVFGPVEDDGFGIAYYPTAEALRITVSWKIENRNRAQEFVEELTLSAKELFRLLGIERRKSHNSMSFV
nr:choline/carnitine O-acyltransferase [Endozoicomonas sp.]